MMDKGHCTITSRLPAMSDLCIRIDREGNWFCNGSPVTNENICLYFARHIAKDTDGGYLLQTKTQQWPLEVEDTPFVVKQCSLVTGSELLFTIVLNDRTSETVAWRDIWLDGESQIYCSVKEGNYHARFNRNSQFAFACLLDFDAQRGRYYINHNGTRHYLASYESVHRSPCG